MRYALAGGQQINAEVATGLNYCIKAHENYRQIINQEGEVREAFDGLMASLGHRRTILADVYQKVNIGISQDDYISWIVLQFEGDYVRFERLPELQGTSLVFEGCTVNGATTETSQGNLKVDIYFHHLAPVSRGQIAHTNCLDVGRIVASLLAPPRPGYSYNDLSPQVKYYDRCVTPYDVPQTVLGPPSYSEAIRLHREVSVNSSRPSVDLFQWVISDEWDVDETNFKVSADIDEFLDANGPGVYRVVVWGAIDGATAIIADYPVFWQVDVPTGYD